MTNSITEYIMFILVLVVAGLLCGRSHITAGANRMYNHPGETHPVTVEAAIGTDFNITCYMNLKTFPGKNSSCLHFVIGRTNEELSQQNIITINSTTIVYMVYNASEQQTEYRCKCGPDAIMETKVFVGSRPRPGTDFSCQSYDFNYMICNFTKPPNPVLTTYNVSYYNDFPSYIYQPQCNYEDRNLVVCNISLKDRYQEIYHFTIESSNALVKPNEPPLIQRFIINNFDIMIPSKPGDNIRVENLTVDSVKLSWQMANWEKYRAKGLQWEILLEPENSTILVCDGPVREHNELRLHLYNLPYAFWRYKLLMRVRVKNSIAFWSEQFVYTFRTAACRPRRPPIVQPGSFYIDSTETRVTIYWEELLRNEYNGDNFTYVINSVDTEGNLLDIKPIYQKQNLAKFSWRRDSYYEFQVRSCNHIGDSLEASRLIIYPTNQRNAKEFTPQAIHNVYHANNRTYTLTWLKPKNLTDLLGFTVYWCYPKRALPNECKESVHFQQIPADQLNFTTKAQNALEEHALNLAVSADYYLFNTGLHWTDCTMDVNSDLVKMDPELVVSANTIKIQWSVERVCPSILDGFNITYCEVTNDAVFQNASCLAKKLFTKLAKKNDKKLYINDLKPFTRYKVSMYMFSRTKKGKPSEPQVVRTLEGAPSPPRQLRVEDITNTSATIKWYEPSHPNGNIRKYIIMLNNDQIEVNASTLSYQLENLESFTAYKVYVLAETIKRSETSNDVHFTTAIGTPSPPGIAPNNNIASIIQWSKPVKPRGPIEYYEVLVKQIHKENIIRRRISIITGTTSCSFTKAPSCIGSEYKTTVEVRAVNVVPLTDESVLHTHNNQNLNDYSNNEDLECVTSISQTEKYFEKVQKYLNNSLYKYYISPWQTSAIYSCSTSRMSKITTIALVVVTMSLGVMAALYIARKKYNKMANINCTLPAGLETYLTKETRTGFHNDFGSGNQAIKNTRVAEDQWITAARMQEINFRNEHHHLLASLGNDLGYLDGGRAESGINCSNDIKKHPLDSNLQTSKISDQNFPRDDYIKKYEQEILKTFPNTTLSNVESLEEGTVESDCQNNDSSLTLFTHSNGYIKQSTLPPWQTFNEQYDSNTEMSTVPATPCGYLTIQNLNENLLKLNTQTNFTPNNNGYVLQQDLPNLFKRTVNVTTSEQNDTKEYISQLISNGYTSLENISKLNLNTSLEPQNECHQQLNDTVGVNATDHSGDVKSGSISGYVTQHDLNLFAQFQQNN